MNAPHRTRVDGGENTGILGYYTQTCTSKQEGNTHKHESRFHSWSAAVAAGHCRNLPPNPLLLRCSLCFRQAPQVGGRGLGTGELFCKGSGSTHVASEGHAASVSAAQLCTAVKWLLLCYNKTLFTNTGRGPAVACGLWLVTAGLGHWNWILVFQFDHKT